MILLMVMAAWMSTWLVIALRLRKPPASLPPTWLLNTLWLFSLALHGASLLLPWIDSQQSTVDFLTALSIVLWLTNLLLFVTQLSRPLETLGLFVLPFIPPVVLANYFLPHAGTTIHLNNGLGLHIFLSLLAYSMLTLAAMQALLLALQNRQLHNHHPGGLIRTLPPLQDMESLLFKLLLLGVILLTLGLVSGFIYLDGLFGKRVAHKTILSIIAWLTFSTLLFGHWRYGWRGKKAIRWTLAGFIALMLAFFGSKFVLEYLVKPT